MLPPGWSTLFAFAAGIVGVVLGMDQVWYRGVVAVAIAGADQVAGGDVGIWLGIAFSGIVYVGARTLEKSKYGR